MILPLFWMMGTVERVTSLSSIVVWDTFGAVGYGLSLQLYLRAQRVVGAARTASVFAAAPFVGVAVAMMVGTPWPGAVVALSAALMAAGMWLHATEHHAHAHGHLALDHNHAHVHNHHFSHEREKARG